MADQAELDDYQWLVSEEGATWLDLVGSDNQGLHVWARRLRTSLSVPRTHLVLEQVALRDRAEGKFCQAQRMFFTPLGLQQATDEWVARYKARRFPAQQSLADYCCGIGGDLLGLARRGPIVGVDLNATHACLANANVQQCVQESQVQVRHDDVLRLRATSFDACHVDPDRRAGGQRHVQPADYRPGLGFLDELRRKQPNLAIKLAPAAKVTANWQQEGELEWISSRRECRQLVVWFGDLATARGTRRATRVIVDDDAIDGVRAQSIVGDPSQEVVLAKQLGRYVYEPDPAIIASRLVGAVAAKCRLGALAPHVAFLTGDALCADPLLSCFEIQDCLPLHTKKLSHELRRRGVGTLEIKTRGVDCDPAKLRRQLRISGNLRATLIVTRLEDRRVALLAQRVDRGRHDATPRREN